MQDIYIMIARRKFRTKKARKRELIRRTLMLGGGTVALLLILWGVVFGSQMKVFRIKQLYVDSPGILTQEQIASVLESKLDEKFLNLIPKDSIFLLSHHSLKEELKETYPRVESVTLNRLSPYALQAQVNEYEPDALWCGDLVPPISTQLKSESEAVANDIWGTCYFMSKEGYIYAKAPLYSDDLFPRYYGSLERAQPVGQFFIESSTFKEWQEFYHSLKKEEIIPRALLFVDEQDAELYLSNGYNVYIPRKENLKQILARLVTVLHSENIQKEKEVAYIDLRFGNKAFIKYVDENKEE